MKLIKLILKRKNKHLIFIDKMRELGYEPEDYWKFKCIGCKPIYQGHNEVIWSDKYTFLYERLPPHTSKCFCTHHPLRYNFYIYCEEDDILLTVGSECVNKVGDSYRKKLCDGCGDRHLNTKDNYCNKCRLENEIKKKEEEERIHKIRRTFRNIKCWDCGIQCEPYLRCKKCHFDKQGWNFSNF